MPYLPDPILLVEDNPDDAALTLRAFRRSQVSNPMVVARDGIEALDFLFARDAFADRAGQPLPKLVLLDLKLPRLDGIGVLREIRADPRTRLVPVIMLTSSLLDQDLDACYSLGANSYLVKPIDYSEFVDMTRVIATYWLTLNRPPPASLPLLVPMTDPL
ncbi:response regulator [Actimicrobium sp. CCI2.3]|uniref:response regulator n=1 Tax=Actimicrobium sp. CCI2.3 TaxID=3048616 RepID=UPI002AB53551|nr:response regulator [Actimicrobium sp. CCI2.3]MDY7574630.1 response regulator [Actimicrobium sp. CCI2.3]MEB0023977.1 response regulator [Actimicrobium sp. CCI2.3]